MKTGEWLNIPKNPYRSMAELGESMAKKAGAKVKAATLNTRLNRVIMSENESMGKYQSTLIACVRERCGDNEKLANELLKPFGTAKFIHQNLRESSDIAELFLSALGRQICLLVANDENLTQVEVELLLNCSLWEQNVQPTKALIDEILNSHRANTYKPG